MKKFLLFLAAALLASAQNVVDINLNDSDIEAGYEHIKKFSRNTKIYTSAHFLRGESTYSKQSGWKRKNWLTDIQTSVMGLTAIPGLSVGIGAKGILAKVDYSPLKDWDLLGFGIKGDVLYALPISVKTYIHVLYVYGPNSLAFMDLKSFYDFRAQLDVEIIDGGMIYGGFRDIGIKSKRFEKDYFEFNKAFFVGVKFVF
ncbi:MAG: YfaZ family outer membrane protein [Helicobacteraceae bacterium]